MALKQLAFVFPGQGSQKVGMLAAAAERFPLVRDTFAEASQVLGYDLWKLVQEGPQEELNLTERTQPMLLTASVALWRVWNAQGGAQPSLMAGHSLGEFSALVCSGVIDFAGAVELVRQRGAYMQSAVPVGVGAMAAIIGLEDEAIVTACAEAAEGECVSAVNFNSPGQVVIAGHATAVERAIAKCKAAGAKRAMPLPVSAPFHTALMRPAGERLAEHILAMEFRAPTVPVVHNVHAQTELDPARIKQLMIDQIHSPVQWTACVEFMARAGVTATVECGPGKVLSGLNKRVEKSLSTYALEDVEGLDEALVAVQALA